jgi:hypothetical protein
VGGGGWIADRAQPGAGGDQRRGAGPGELLAQARGSSNQWALELAGGGGTGLDGSGPGQVQGADGPG